MLARKRVDQPTLAQLLFARVWLLPTTETSEGEP